MAFDGTVFEAASGFSASELESGLGLKVDTLDVESALNSERLSEDDLASGLYDDAAVEIFRVNWAEPEQRVLMRTGNLGEVVRGTLFFRAEVRGLAHALQQPKGRIIQANCDADLGDARCRVDLDQPAYKAQGIVTEIESERVFVVSGLGTFARDWFARGLLTWTSGANAGRRMEVKLHSRTPNTETGTVTIELWQRMPSPVAQGDAFLVTAGCDKRFSTCREKFANGANFRGFPHVPGNDFALSYPNRGDRKNDGGSFFR